MMHNKILRDYMGKVEPVFISNHQNTGQNHSKTSGSVAELKYLGMAVINKTTFTKKFRAY
jgi:hypothetical protein